MITSAIAVKYSQNAEFDTLKQSHTRRNAEVNNPEQSHGKRNAEVDNPEQSQGKRNAEVDIREQSQGKRNAKVDNPKQSHGKRNAKVHKRGTVNIKKYSGYLKKELNKRKPVINEMVYTADDYLKLFFRY